MIGHPRRLPEASMSCTTMGPSPGHESESLAYAAGTNRTGPGEGITKSVHTTTHQVHGHNTGTDAGVQGNRKAGAPATLVSEPGLA